MQVQHHAGRAGAMLDHPKDDRIYLEDMSVGLSRAMTRTVTDADIRAFADATGDRNPVHLDDAYAASTVFGGRIAHGMLTAGHVSAVIGERLPGHGTIYLSQSFRFLAPVRPGDSVVTTVTVTAIDSARARVTLETRCMVGDTTVLKGEALVLALRRG